MNKKDYTKKEPLLVTSIRLPESDVKRIKKEKINLSLLVRKVLEDLWSR